MIRYVLSFLLLVAVVLLSGCLFTVNHPIVAPDGTIALFLEQDGGYMLFPETGVLHLFRGGEWVPVPAAALPGSGGLVSLSPDGSELLYVAIQSGEFLDPLESTLYRVALRPDAVPEVVLETENVIVKADWVEDGRILILQSGEEDLATLELLDPVTGEMERLCGGLLTFEISERQGRLILIGIEDEGGLSVGFVESWDPVTDRREDLAAFLLSENTSESFAMLPHDFLWDVSPDGRWLALVLYEGTMLEPTVEYDLPSLYLIDTEFDEAERIAVDALMPCFSPDGDGLIYLQEGEGDTSVVMWRDLQADACVPITDGEGVSTAFWLSPGRLGMTFEVDDDRVRLVELDLASGETRELIGAPAD